MLDTTDNDFVTKLVSLRLQAGLTVEEVSERMGVQPYRVRALEAGEADPRLSTLRHYALAVGAEIEHAVDAIPVSPGGADTPDAIERAAVAICNDIGGDKAWDQMPPKIQDNYRSWARAALRAAGVAEWEALRSERDALSSLLRGMARRVVEVRDEMRFATNHVDGWRKRADRLRSQRDHRQREVVGLWEQLRARQDVPDQTPSTTVAYDERAVHRVALHLFRVHTYGTSPEERYHTRARHQWYQVLDENDREAWRRTARELINLAAAPAPPPHSVDRGQPPA